MGGEQLLLGSKTSSSNHTDGSENLHHLKHSETLMEWDILHINWFSHQISEPSTVAIILPGPHLRRQRRPNLLAVSAKLGVM